MMRSALILLIPIALLPASPAAGTSCIACHTNPEYVDDASIEMTTAFEDGVHADVGLSCHDCHGGNPDPALAEDMEAMDEAYGPSPFSGVPPRTEIPGSCGRCHSDPTYMKRFRPDARVDQEREYWTSQHGQALITGDSNVAVCTDCHTVHKIRRASDPEAAVYPTRVAETCGACHADPDHMRGYTDSHGRELPVTQLALWQRSVHAKSMLEKGDLTAPTCNDCHGNHGAAPPGLESVSFVCGQCHGREADLFRASTKHDGFQTHNEFLADSADEGCAACHDSPQANIDVASFTECATCHGNHGVIRPTVAMFSSLPETPCQFCHETQPDDGGGEPLESVRRQIAKRLELVQAASEKGFEGQERFDWLVDQALALPSHTLTSESDGEVVLRPEFADLFHRFRIGKSYSTFIDPISGNEVRAPIVRCGDCHHPESGSAASDAAAAMIARNRELMLATAKAERTLLAARRGGVEVGEVLTEVEHAVDAGIGMAVLVHTFDAGTESAFGEQYAEGVSSAESALEKGQEALAELAFRRRGLGVSLVIILALLVALGLKIRSLPS
jgi:hypothetical protein